MSEAVGADRAARRAVDGARRRKIALGSAGVLTVGASVVSGSTPASAQTFTVTNTNDSGEGSLRQAIANAEAAPGADTISISATGPVNLVTELEFIDNPVTINGPASDDFIVYGAGTSSVFYLYADTTIRDITIRGGDGGAGGGVLICGAAATLDGVSVEDNNADFAGGGVAVFQEGDGPCGVPAFTNTAKATLTGVDLTIVESMISGNNAGQLGGGVYVGPGTGAIIDRSTVADNEVGGEFSVGGGVFVNSSDADSGLVVENSTIAGNDAGAGGGIGFGAPYFGELNRAKDAGPYGDVITIRHSTVYDNDAADNGGSLFEFNNLGLTSTAKGGVNTVIVDHSILSGNRVGGGATGEIIANTSVAARFSIIGGEGTPYMDLGGNIRNTDPGLGPLADNGGPTWTHLPLDGSPAIDAGDPTFAPPPVTDQRGEPREQDRVDIGAVETEGDGTPQPPRPPTDDSICDPAPEDGFVDVPETNVHEASVDCIASLEITTGGPVGRPDNEYGPEIEVSRAQIMSFLARLVEAAGGELPAAPPDAFGDDNGNEHELRINQMAAIGVATGIGEGEFGPTVPLRRDHMATFVAKTYEFIAGEALAAGPDAFDDDDGNAHEANINALAAAGIVVGTDEEANLYSPGGTVRRDQMATFLTNLIRVLDDADLFAPEPAE